MLIIIAAIVVVYFLVLYFKTEGGKYYLYEDSLYYEEYEKELQDIREKSGKVSCDDYCNVYEKYVQKEKKHYRILIILLVFLGLIFLLFTLFGTYEEIEITKYELVAIQDEELPEDKYYICEYVNKENSYMFYYKRENNIENLNIVAGKDNLIKEYVNCNPYVIEQKKVKKTRLGTLQKILFFKPENQLVEANYKFYILEDSILKTFE